LPIIPNSRARVILAIKCVPLSLAANEATAANAIQ
jgi:hypothetical protein